MEFMQEIIRQIAMQSFSNSKDCRDFSCSLLSTTNWICIKHFFDVSFLRRCSTMYHNTTQQRISTIGRSPCQMLASLSELTPWMTNIRSFTTLRSYLNVITPQTRHRADCQSVLSVVVQLGCIYIRACLLDFGQSRNKYASTCKTMSLSELNRSERANDAAKHKITHDRDIGFMWNLFILPTNSSDRQQFISLTDQIGSAVQHWLTCNGLKLMSAVRTSEDFANWFIHTLFRFIHSASTSTCR